MSIFFRAGLFATISHIMAASAPSATNAQSSYITCRIYAKEDISNSQQRRARFFVATASNDPHAATALGYGLALEVVANQRLDFVRVFVTRNIDGLRRADHNAGTALAIISFNPGNTPVIKTRLEGQVVTSEITDEGVLAVLTTPKRRMINAEVNLAWLDAKDDGVIFGCLGR